MAPVTAVAQVWSLAGQIPHAMGVTKEKEKRKENKEKEREKLNHVKLLLIYFVKSKIIYL